MKFTETSLALGLTTLIAASPAFATNIVASIKPIELIVKAVAGDNTNVSTIVPPGSSPHNYSMKPSQRRALEQADAIFWVGPEMETFLNRLLGGKEFAGKVVAFTEATSEEPEAHHEHEHEHHHHDHGEGEDPHLWVDPGMALEMAKTIHAKLSTLDNINTVDLDANLEQFEQSLGATERGIKASLSQLDGTSLFAYHSALERFAEHYELELAGVLTLNPELSPGARHIAEVQNKLRAANQPCLLTEPQFNRQWWRSITEGLNVTVSTWDPLATDIASTANGYLEFQQSIADAVLECLPK
ncbi:zinc ABC transporter substrate-binding protein [Marinobacter sp. AL4B]|uniref:zinc ABC transporter substrate-binding protein n=1 Tax=Marinobacter sp. AL4B TaxID=2871173 RepID=UPI001CAA6DDC|nr:zinc ABC transporter substrate-binding protein [Marinobacter sp. AL4B]MBZ0333879.1 zinc ABC transporter substrate-binding protein [Marinobacter sp. AL4B]